MLAALCLSAASAVTFLFARGLTALLIGRVLSGLSAGIASGTATAWLVDLAGRRGKQHATLLAVAANIGGLAFGPLVAGLLAGLAPSPLRVPFVVDLALLAPALLGVWLAPEPLVVPNPRIKLRMQSMRVPPEVSDIFPPAATVGVCAFAVAGVFSAVAPEFLGNELGDKSPVRAGLLVFLFFAMAASGQLTVNRIPKRLGLAVGCVVLIVGLGLLAAALAAQVDRAALSVGGRLGSRRRAPGRLRPRRHQREGRRQTGRDRLRLLRPPLLRGRAAGRRGRLRGARRRDGHRGSSVLRTRRPLRARRALHVAKAPHLTTGRCASSRSSC